MEGDGQKPKDSETLDEANNLKINVKVLSKGQNQIKIIEHLKLFNDIYKRLYTNVQKNENCSKELYDLKIIHDIIENLVNNTKT